MKARLHKSSSRVIFPSRRINRCHFSSTPEQLVAAVTALGLAFALSACGIDDATDIGAGNGAGSGTGADADTTPDGDTATEDASPVLSHEEALAAGLNEELAITCGYTYDEQELAGLRMLSPSAEVPPEATIYMDRGTIYWDIPQPDGRMSHMLATDGFLYTWKVPSESKAIKSEDVTNGGGDELQKRLTKNAHDCKAYDGPASIFQPPTDITFVEIG